MEINITCVLQIGHFIIVFLMLKKLLFKPLVAIVHEEDRVLHDLQQAVDARRILVSQREQELHSQWAEQQQEFAQSMVALRAVDEAVKVSKMQSCPPVEMQAQEKQALMQDIKHEIIARVERAH